MNVYIADITSIACSSKSIINKKIKRKVVRPTKKSSYTHVTEEAGARLVRVNEAAQQQKELHNLRMEVAHVDIMAAKVRLECANTDLATAKAKSEFAILQLLEFKNKI